MNRFFFLSLFLLLYSSAFADNLITHNISGGCSDNFSYSAVYETNVYHCNIDTYLPAGGIVCKKCPSEYKCNGGIFEYSTNRTQGLTEGDLLVDNVINGCGADFMNSFMTVYTPNKHDCATGFYMPANTDGCVECPENNYCAGGTYTFNETVTQGITPCPESEPNAPAGMWLESQCGRKLHVAGEYLYLHKSPATPTPHRLYVRVNDNVYSANTTPISESPDLKISVNAQRSLHVKIDGVEYLIHDDSVR